MIIFSSTGTSWTKYAATTDRVFVIQHTGDEGMEVDTPAHLIREVRWMFGDLRIIIFTEDDDWLELVYDADGMWTIVPYAGPVPIEEEFSHE